MIPGVRASIFSVLITPVLLLACSSSEENGPTDAGQSISCDEVLKTCPESRPPAETACEGSLVCEYEDARYTCEQGRLREEILVPGGSPAVAERCKDPFAGTVTGATLEVGPATGGFRPYLATDRVQPVFGAQGFAMVDFRLHVAGIETAPECVGLKIGGRLDGMDFPPQSFGVVLRCGQSLRVFAILPERPCEIRDYGVELSIEAEGVGTANAAVILEGGRCPR
jgi:hypothetical protein